MCVVKNLLFIQVTIFYWNIFMMLLAAVAVAAIIIISNCVAGKCNQISTFTFFVDVG